MNEWVQLALVAATFAVLVILPPMLWKIKAELISTLNKNADQAAEKVEEVAVQVKGVKDDLARGKP